MRPLFSLQVVQHVRKIRLLCTTASKAIFKLVGLGITVQLYRKEIEKKTIKEYGQSLFRHHILHSCCEDSRRNSFVTLIKQEKSFNVPLNLQGHPTIIRQVTTKKKKHRQESELKNIDGECATDFCCITDVNNWLGWHETVITDITWTVQENWIRCFDFMNKT